MADRSPSAREGYEHRDTRVRLLAWLLAGLLAATLVVLLLAWVRSPLSGRRHPPEPRLQNTPFDELRRMRAEEDAALTSYGWVDRQAGIVRIPIEQALEIASRGGVTEEADRKTAAPSGGTP